MVSIIGYDRLYLESLRIPSKKILCFEWSPPWHSIHPIWHSIWHIYLAFHVACLLTFYLATLLTFYLAYLLTFCLSYLLTFYLAYLLTLLTFYLAYLIAFYLANLLTFCLANLLAVRLSYLLTFYLAYLLTFYLAYLLAFSLAFYMALFVAVRVRLRSGEAHGAQNLAGWGPAKPTALRISPVEVRPGPQRSECRRLRSGGPQCSDSRRLRSGEAHSAQTLAGWGPAKPTALRLSPDEVRRGPLLIKSWQMRSGEEKEEGRRRKKEGEGRRRKEKEGEGRRSRATNIKSIPSPGRWGKR